MIEPMTSLAFSVYSGKGVHALLLGSGISRTSGIPTGWEIVLHLIKKIAVVQGQDCGTDPAAWYRATFGKEPDYSDLLELTAKGQTERMNLLQPYFEPSEDGQKLPTKAHHAIAQLVRDGYIRVIVTTNFDRLMERALEAVDVVPSVIASTDAINGSKPLAHSRCTIIKVHGDYLDTRIKNVSGEIDRYDDALNTLLDQVFDEYGLIVCGWSAEWDAALRAAIERCSNRRYTTYWSAYGEVTGAAQELCRQRDAQVVKGMGADDFFTKLAEKVAALKDMDAPHPLSTRMAVATLKRYLPEEKESIRLHDLMMDEAGKAVTALFEGLGTNRPQPTLLECEAKLETLLPLLAAGGYWGRPKHRQLWLRCFQQLVTPRSMPWLVVPLDFYPVYLALYAYGIGSLAGSRSGNLAYVLGKATVKNPQGKHEPLLDRVILELRDIELDNAIQNQGRQPRGINIPSSRHLFKVLREPLRLVIAEDAQYQEYFHRFEYIVHLAFAHDFQKEHGGNFDSILGLYLKADLAPLIDAEIARSKEKWPYLRAGLFEGSLDRLMKVKTGFDQWANKAVMGLRLR